MIYVGIDPGVSGGVAAIGKDKVHFGHMPSSERWVCDWLEEIQQLGKKDGEGTITYLEWIGTAIFGCDKSSMSKLYGSYKGLSMALTALCMPHQIVKPEEWQSGIGIQKRSRGESRTAWKSRLKAEAARLFPPLKVTLATADALLIAEYCRRRNGGYKDAKDFGQASLFGG